MLTLLNISNIALIDELRVEFNRGLNLLTGETGSGKSIIVDALGVLIGGRFGSDLLKSGAERAFIEGLFSVAPNAELEAILEAAGIELGSGDESPAQGRTTNGRATGEAVEAHEIIIRRELSTTGKNRSEEHTSELQSPCNLVCRLLLEKKKIIIKSHYIRTTLHYVHMHHTQ